MSLFVIDPIGSAFARTNRILCQPFDFGKWLRLAFCAFLMGLAAVAAVEPPVAVEPLVAVEAPVAVVADPAVVRTSTP